MLHCPQCLAEYGEGATECIDCRTPLKPGPPPESSKSTGIQPEPKLLRIRTFSGPTAVMEADLARNLLQDQGILSFIPGETSAEILPGVDLVQLWVREEDGNRAAELLQTYLDATDSSEAEEPDSSETEEN